MICIITFRRPEQLRRLLEALARQSYGELSVTITVVDNDPGGSAQAPCDGFSAESGLRLQYSLEPEPGIVAARNRCAAEFLKSNCSYMAFIDDDEWPAVDDWLVRLVRCAGAYSADIVAADVVSEARSEVPVWATEILYAASTASEGSAVEIFYTGNVLISRTVIENLSPPFDQRFALSGASDYHFALRCARAGYKAVHADAAVIEEFPLERATVPWFLKRGFRSGAGYTRSHLIEDAVLTVIPKCLALAGARLLMGAGLTLAGVLTFSKTRLVKGLFRCASAIGTVVGLGGFTYQEYQTLHR
ncbi:MAG: glycosyltransferase family 2 protein [Congregibacter sp.]